MSYRKFGSSIARMKLLVGYFNIKKPEDDCRMKETLIKEFKALKEETGQASVELILLIGSILVITIICGTYVFNVNSKINSQFNQTMTKARLFLLNKVWIYF